MRNGPGSGTKLEGVATIFGLFGEDFGRIHELTGVERRGEVIHAEACEPLRIGMVVCVGFEQRGVVAARGVVEACESSADSWRVAIRAEGRVAA